MVKNVFVCHRPYHILRSCDIITKLEFNSSYNVLITYDVVQENGVKFQDFKSNNLFYSFFDEVIKVSRVNLPNHRNTLKTIKTYKSLRLEYGDLVSKHYDADSLYFYSDAETEIEIMVGLFWEHKKRYFRSILVDEGLATYSKSDHSHASLKGRLYLKSLTALAGVRYFNYSSLYGKSRMYNYSLANNPDKACFRKPIGKLTPLSAELCSSLRAQLSDKYELMDKRLYFIFVGSYDKTLNSDIPVIEGLKSVLDNYGIFFYIKLHPVQNEALHKEYFNKISFIDKGVPIELFFGKNIILGGTCSSSLYYAHIQGLPSFNISPLYKEGELTFDNNLQTIGWADIPEVFSFEDFEGHIKALIANSATV